MSTRQTFVLMVLFILVLINCIQGTTYYVSTQGSNNNNGRTEAAAWESFSYAISIINTGDELIILDGVYYQSINFSKSGTAGTQIFIKAKNDGKVVIDGQNSQQPLNISGNYIIIEGVIFQNSSGEVVNISGNYNIMRRCSAYNANPDGNNHIFCVTGDYNLLEDCAAGGTGRYCYLIYGCRGNTLRRCFGKWKNHNSGSPRAVFCPYGAAENTFENCIGTGVYPSNSVSMEHYGIYHEMNQYSLLYNDFNRYLGCVIYNNLYGGIVLSNMAGPHVEFINCVFFDHDRTHPSHNSGSCGNGIAAAGTHSQMVVKNCTFVNHRLTALWYSGTNPITNCLFMNNNRCFNKSDNHQYCCFYNNSSIGGSIHSTDIQVDPNFKNKSYIYIPDDSPCKAAGQNGEDIGANVLYRYLDGVLTDEPLWPWPMNQRILNEIGYDVTATLFSGTIPEPIFKTGINAYPSSGPNPLTVNFNSNTDGGNLPYRYSWSFGDGNNSDLQNPNHTYTQTGNYTAVLTVTNNDGNQATASIIIHVIDPSNDLSIRDIKFTLSGENNRVSQLQRETWYDLYIYFNTPNGWSEIAFADVWINSPSYSEGSISNRGGVFHAASSYVMSFSIAEGNEGIWSHQTDGASNSTNVTGTLGLYVDDRNNEFEINNSQGWVKAKVKLLVDAEIGNWFVNAYVRSKDGVNSTLYKEDLIVISQIDLISPSTPQNVVVIKP